jgi:hypothetical protein
MTGNDEAEVVTTARSLNAESSSGGDGSAGEGGSGAGGTSVMREWVDELTGRTDRANSGLRVPSDEEITTLVGIFPDVGREVVIAALQRRYVSQFFCFETTDVWRMQLRMCCTVVRLFGSAALLRVSRVHDAGSYCLVIIDHLAHCYLFFYASSPNLEVAAETLLMPS